MHVYYFWSVEEKSWVAYNRLRLIPRNWFKHFYVFFSMELALIRPANMLFSNILFKHIIVIRIRLVSHIPLVIEYIKS